MTKPAPIKAWAIVKRGRIVRCFDVLAIYPREPATHLVEQGERVIPVQIVPVEAPSIPE